MKKCLIIFTVLTISILGIDKVSASVEGSGVTIVTANQPNDRGFVRFENAQEGSFINFVVPTTFGSNTGDYVSFLVGGNNGNYLSSVTSMTGEVSGINKYHKSYAEYFDELMYNTNYGFGNRSGITGDFAFGYSQLSSGRYVQFRVYLKAGSSGLIAWQLYNKSAGFLISSSNQTSSSASSNFQTSVGSYNTASSNVLQQETNDKLDDVNTNIQDTNDTIKDDNISGSQDTAGGFFQDFEDNDHGLSGIITAPLNLITSITSSSCTALHLNVPFVDKEFDIPCMTSIYQEHFGSVLTIYQTITFGIISYWVCVNIYAMVKGFKDPNNDKVEVLDL